MSTRVRTLIFSPTPIEDTYSIWIDTSSNYSFKIKTYQDGEWISIETPITEEFQELMQEYAAENLIELNAIQEDMLLKADLVEGKVPLQQLPDVVQVGSKFTNIDAGIFGQMSLTDDFFYICVKTGETDAIWKRFALTQT